MNILCYRIIHHTGNNACKGTDIHRRTDKHRDRHTDMGSHTAQNNTRREAEGDMVHSLANILCAVARNSPPAPAPLERTRAEGLRAESGGRPKPIPAE